MAAGAVRLEPLAEAHRAALKAACAEDLDVWQIYSISFDPDQFDANFDMIRSRPDWRCFALFHEDRLVGMSSFIGIDEARGVLEIGCTYYAPAMRGTGFNARVKDLMLARAFACGFRRIELRVDARNGRSQAAVAKIGGVRDAFARFGHLRGDLAGAGGIGRRKDRLEISGQRLTGGARKSSAQADL